jgi:hypothetical protein
VVAEDHLLNLRQIEGISGQKPLIGVIPGENEPHNDFCNMLKAYPLALHGLFHHSEKSARTLKGHFVNIITSAEAEFSGLGKEKSRELLHRAYRQWMRHCPERALRFIPPCWHGNPWLKSQVEELRFEYFEERTRLWVRQSDGCLKGYFNFPLSFTGRNRLWTTLNILLFKLLISLNIPCRIVLHPVDFRNPLQKPVKNFLLWAKATGRLTSFEEFLHSLKY